MSSSVSFKPVDLDTWPMAQTYYFYTKYAITTYTLNVDVDVTILRKTLKSKGYKFFPAYLYLVTKAIENIPELRMAKKDDVLGCWDSLSPTYPQFHEDSHTVSLIWTEYSDDFHEFYNRYLEDTKLYGNNPRELFSKGRPLPNTYMISCIPWFTFNSFSLHNHGIKDYFFPSFEAGGFKEQDGKTIMPLSITVHHATTDGYHIKLFLDELGDLMNNPQKWL